MTLANDGQVAEAPSLDEELAFAKVYADHIFAVDGIAPTALSADDNVRSEAISSDENDVETPWLADELLERVFG
jgi:hypothetical protein